MSAAGEGEPKGAAAGVAPAALSGRALALVFVRSLVLQAAWNPQGMQNLGFCYAVCPALDELYPDRAARARAAERHLEFFNCHPYLAAAILGACLRLEEQVARGEQPPEAVSALKRTLGPPLAALGDGFFWLALRPAAALAALLTIPLLGLWSLLVFLGLYDLFHLSARIWLFSRGYAMGPAVVGALARAHVPSGIGLLRLSASVLAGALVGGALLSAVPLGPLRVIGTATAVAAGVLLWPRVPLGVLLYGFLLTGLVVGIVFS
jgi:PTS system mannose-specific IID component